MGAVRRDLDLEAYATLRMPCKYLTAPDINGVRSSALPVGWSIKVQWRKHVNDTTVLQELTPLIDHATGAFEVYLSGDDVALLPSLSWWGMKAYGPGNEPAIPLAEGKSNVSGGLVR